MTTTQQLDQQKAEEFAGKVLGILNGACLAFMTGIGHQTGLFETMAKLPPSTSEEVARAAGLNERYVREWLGAMVTGRIINYDPATRTYSFPPEHAASLTQAAGPNNMGPFFQYFALMGIIEPRVIDCFRNGGGVSYQYYSRFQELQAEETARIFDASLVNGILPLVPGLTQRLEAGIRVADIGCGSGHAINLMAKAFPKSSFVGYDISEEGVGAGRAEARRLGLSNARFEVKDTTTLNVSSQFDLITTFDVIHDLAQPSRVLKNIAKALKPDGVFLMQDVAASSYVHENIDHPLGPTLYTFSTMHCMTVSLAQGGEGLGTVWGTQKAQQMLADAGFTQVEVKQIPTDVLNNYYIATKC
jgi:2-polyprenyl-3-methyl-5-hydroxy-6-metoxy-1,4-benzoquinol methylase